MAKMKTTTYSNKSDYLNTTPLAIFWRGHRVKFRNLFFLSLCLFLFSGCSIDTSWMNETTTTTIKPRTTTTTTIIPQCPVQPQCPKLDPSCKDINDKLVEAQLKLAVQQEAGLNSSYYIQKLRVFRNQTDKNYIVANSTLDMFSNFSAYEYNKTQKKKLQTLKSQLLYLTARLKEMGNR